VKFCKFANNSAGNNEGNDIFASVVTGYFGDPGNINNDCSVSATPGRLVIGNLV
jgi:hypothetical protein